MRLRENTLILPFAPFSAALAVWAILGAILLAGPAFAASEDTSRVRFFHAVPGVGEATFTVGDTEVGAADFGAASGFAAVPAGSAELALATPDGELAGEGTFKAGKAYTVIALSKGQSAELRVYADGAAKPGIARVRMIHAAPELGMPDLRMNGKLVSGKAEYAAATRYWNFQPGTYRASVEDPGTGETVIDPMNVPLGAGTASTLVVVGSKGETARTVLLADQTAAPSVAPAAGLGGLAGESGSSWTLALLAAGLAGALGALAFGSMTGRAASGASRRSDV